MPLTTAAQIEDAFLISRTDFSALPLDIRALYRMAFQADILHVVEDGPPYDNRGEEVERVQALAGCGPGDAWCAADWTAMLLDSGADRSKLPDNPASVEAWLEWAKAANRVDFVPRRGYAGLIIGANGDHHLVAVNEADGDTLRSIAGNTVPMGNPGSIREGYGVFRRLYNVDVFHCFVRCDGLG